MPVILSRLTQVRRLQAGVQVLEAGFDHVGDPHAWRRAAWVRVLSPSPSFPDHAVHFFCMAMYPTTYQEEAGAGISGRPVRGEPHAAGKELCCASCMMHFHVYQDRLPHRHATLFLADRAFLAGSTAARIGGMMTRTARCPVGNCRRASPWPR